VPSSLLEKKALGYPWLHYDVTMNRKASTNGSVKKRPASARVPLTIRLPETVIKRIDEELGRRDVPLSRNNWLLEAAIEKLRKAGSGGSHGAK
jgi:hypothetical protein